MASLWPRIAKSAALAATLLVAGTVCAAEPPDSDQATRRKGPSEVVVADGPTVRHLDLRGLPKAHLGVPMAHPKDQEEDQEHDLESRQFSAWTRGGLLDAIPGFQAPGKAQAFRSPLAFGQPSPVVNGINYTGTVPADPTGDAGPNHYVQAVNGASSSVFAVFDKVTGAQIAGPIALSSLSSGNCSGTDSDPQVIYDQLANRWVLAHLIMSANRVCLHVSGGSDPINTSWTQYAFDFSFFPDYPKLAVWDSAYALVTNNEFVDASTTNWRTRFAVLDRAAMLAGLPATAQVFESARYSNGSRPFTPVVPVGFKGHNLPKADTPLMFMVLIDEESQFFGEPAEIDFVEDRLQLYTVTPNFANPNASVFGGPTTIRVLDMQFAANRFPSQPGGVQLASFSGTGMHRSTYRNLGDREVITIATNQPAGAFQGYGDPQLGALFGATWIELERIGGAASNWVLADQGNFSLNDGVSRFMAALNVDNAGNLGLAYSAVGESSNLFPSLRYTGRLRGDPAQTMTFAETTLATGVAAQSFTGTTERWGDYFDLSLDPDGCRFWFTGAYMDDSTWGTRIGAFKHDSCGAPNFAFSGPSNVFKVCNVSTTALPPQSVQVNSQNGYWRDVALGFTNLPAGISANVTPTSIRPSGAVTANISVAAGTSPGLYAASLQGTEGVLSNVLNFQIDVDQPTTAASLTAPANAATSQPSIVRLQWDAVPGVDDYVVDVDTDNTFTPPLTMSRITSSTFLDTDLLAGNTTYFWRVRGRNTCGEGTNSSVRSFTTVANFCKTVNTALSNGATVTDTITVPAGVAGVVQNLDIRFVENNVPATNVRVDVTRMSDNLTVRLLETGCSASNAINTIFDDAGTTAPCNNTTLGARTVPTQALTAFDQGNLAGDWRISVSNIGSSNGQFILWCLQPQNLVLPNLFGDSFE
ncbi:hypothetical protein C7S18_11105 [Ahniella affigens]|uniref:Fibronectin type-III domain-containing protein n=1 Tax=Ahniella affigens TaxID=2021234 RepID=A0A2P1PSA9_9GAMM|nr:hypothetical protein C7S18_11105 [Ahniella affigens]